jgi:hypothetical protein
MSEADMFRQYADEAKQGLSQATNEEKLGLTDLASIWAKAALMSDRVFGSSWASRDEKRTK